MNRLQKKCFVVSAGFHLLLPIIIIFGSALTPKSKVEETQILEFLPVDTTDAKISGGGNPNARSAQAAPNTRITPTPAPKPPEPQPAHHQEATSDPEPPKDPVKQPETDPDSFKIGKKKPLNIPTKLVDRNKTDSKNLNRKPAVDTAERDANEAKKKLAQELTSARNSLRDDLSGSTSVELKGPGGGGIPYANFLDTVKTVYTEAWNLPDEVQDDNATTVVSVTIARDGNVVRYSITRKSGNAIVDHSVQMTLERVRFVAPLPRAVTEDERTVKISFNVKAKRLIG